MADAPDWFQRSNAAGPRCAACAEEIRTEARPLDLEGLGRVAICPTCVPAVDKFVETQDFTALPEGPLREMLNQQARARFALGLLEVFEALHQEGGYAVVEMHPDRRWSVAAGAKSSGAHPSPFAAMAELAERLGWSDGEEQNTGN